MRVLRFGDMSFTRNSPAWCPITGRQAPENVPRVVDDLVLEVKKDLTIYHRFPETQGFTAYSPGGYTRPGETTDYLLDLQDALEGCGAAPTRFTLGTSYEGRAIEAFRLGPVNKQHFMVTCAIHGNEVDGLAGSFKAVELIMTHPDFAALREAFTIMYVPCCNPDGHYHHTRGLAEYGPHPSGVDQRINLNRVWPWFWSELVPGSTESKGATALASSEAMALYTYITTANSGAAVPIKFLLDQHSTVGDGARYQSRDKCYREYDQYDWFSVWCDWYMWKYLRALQAKRVHEDPAIPDLWVNYFRSRYRPHWHSWMATRTKAQNGGVAPISIVGEHNKVAYVAVRSDPETYQSACNFNMDHVIACATLMQSGATAARSAVLVEHEAGENQTINSEFSSWQKKTLPEDPAEYRPGYWTPTRASIAGYARDEKHMDHHGKSLEMTPNLVVELPAGQDVGPGHYHDAQVEIGDDTTAFFVVNVAAGGAAVHYWNQSTYSGNLLPLFTDALLPPGNEKRLAGANDTSVSILDLGNVGDNLKLLSYTAALSYVRTVDATFTAPRVGAATAFDGTSKAYVIGGHDGTVEVQTVLEVDRTAGTITELGTNLLTTADADAEAVYCVGGTLDGKIVALGGRILSAGNIRIVQIDPDPVTPSASETLFSVAGTTLPEALIRHGLAYDGVGSLYVYGGEHPVGNAAYRGVWKLTWSGSAWSVTEQELSAGLGSDGDPEDYSGEGLWRDLWSRWRAMAFREANEGTWQVLLLGGCQEDPDTGLKIVQDYNTMYLHDVPDGVLHLPQDYVWTYLRFNSTYNLDGSFDKMAVSWSTKAADATLSGYIRLNTAPGDSAAGLLSTRPNRTYYMHPPRWWYRLHGSLDTAIARPDQTEDQIRVYVRGYRHGQALHVDSPMVQTGTLWPSSWSPAGMVRGVETASWAGAVDPRWMRVSFIWLPFASFLCLTSDVRLLSITDGTRKVELWAVVGDRTERAYRVGYTYSSAEHSLQLRVYDDVGGHTSCDVACYWGGMHKDVTNDRFDSAIGIDIWAHPEVGHGFRVNNCGAVGSNSLLTPFDPSTWGATADVELHGGGWWVEPEVQVVDREWVDEVSVPFSNGALLVGDRDPTAGFVDPRGTFRYTETFVRADDPNLGPYWDIVQQSGAGWDLLGNRAVCTTLGWERWDAQPYLRDCIIFAVVRVNDVGCRVGLFTRMCWNMASNGDVNGYLGSLYVDALGVTTLEIERFYMNAGTQHRTTLISASCTYTLGTDIKLKFEAAGTSLILSTLDGSDVVIDTVSTMDATNVLPEAFGICGETTGSTASVEIDSVYAEPSSTLKTRITE